PGIPSSRSAPLVQEPAFPAESPRVMAFIYGDAPARATSTSHRLKKCRRRQATDMQKKTRGPVTGPRAYRMPLTGGGSPESRRLYGSLGVTGCGFLQAFPGGWQLSRPVKMPP